MQASALLLCWGSYRRARNLRVLNCLFIFSPWYVALCASKARHIFGSEKVSWCLETSLFLRLPSRDGTPSLPLLSLFLSFIFFPTSFRRQRAAFLGAWCPLPAFRSCLWNLLSIQMFFWWICGRESDLPVLFFCHLRTTSKFILFLNSIILLLKERKYWKIMHVMSCNWCEMSTILKECGWAERPSSNHTYIEYFVGVITTFSLWDTPILNWEHNVASPLGDVICDCSTRLRVVETKAWSSQGLCSSSGTP